MSAREPADDRTPDEIDLLLPWHAAERLSPEDAEKVQAALRTDPARARHLDVVREERAETVALNQGLGMPSRKARDTLFARIEAEGRKPARRAERGWRTWLAGLSPPSLAFSAMAAALVIALQAGLLAKHYLGESAPSYETASAPTTAPSADGVFALVAFAPGATVAEIEALLRETRASIADGPRPGGLYRLRLGDRTADAKTMSASIERLRRATKVFRLVAPEASPPR